MAKQFVSLIDIYNIHLIKDIGLIAWGMQYYQGYESTIVTYEHDDLQYLEILPGLTVKKISKITGKFDIDILLYLLKNAKKIDVMNCYHMRSATALKIMLYKILNSKGKVFLKFDGGYFREHIGKFKQYLYKRSFKMADLISTEQEEHSRKLSMDWGIPVRYIQNPYHPQELRDFKPYKDRENIILTVGRIGSNQKATDVLLEAWGRCSKELEKWKLVLVGPIEEKECDFRAYIEAWKARYPMAGAQTLFMGELNNRLELYDLYCNSKVFCFPSRHESFGIAALEAVINGCYIIGSAIPTTYSLTEKFSLGSMFQVDNSKDLMSKLVFTCNNLDECEEKAMKLYRIAVKKYSLSGITAKISSMLEI